MEIAVLGSGSWATAIVKILTQNHSKVHWWVREKEIVKLRFFEGKTQMEVAKEICISQAQVSRLEKSALRSMKNYLS